VKRQPGLRLSRTEQDELAGFVLLNAVASWLCPRTKARLMTQLSPVVVQAVGGSSPSLTPLNPLHRSTAPRKNVAV
jgi:hypothetical protein